MNDTEEELRLLIRNTCNTIGCKDCPFKWETDEDGNSCRSDYLMHKIFMKQEREDE